MKRALETNGKSYIHILCPCPAGWQFETEDTVKVGFWAVESLAFPLYEVGSGFYNLTIRTLKPRPLADYISAQGRFTDVTDKQIKAAGAKIEKEYKKLLENIQPA
jgi:pyruvate ferredoxin oxidoreductase beta subunit